MEAWCSRAVVMVALVAAFGVGAHAQQGSGTPSAGQGSAAPSPVLPQTSGSGKAGETVGTGTSAPSTLSTGARLQFVLGDNNVVRVPAETTTLAVTGVAGLDQMAAADVEKLAKSLVITDRGVVRGTPTHGSFTLVPEFIGRSGVNGLTWRVAVKADVAAGTSHVRVAALMFGMPKPQPYALEFSVSAKPPAASQWTPRGATDVWTVSWSDPPSARVFGITIENPDEPINNLRLAQSTLKDSSGRTIGVERLRLLDRPDSDDQYVIDVPGNSTHTVFLRVEDGASAGPFGTFDGVVRLTADGNSAMKDVSLKVQASSTCRRWLGVGLTLIGLVLTVVVSVLARPQMARLQARRAAAAVRQAITQFVDELARTMPSGYDMPEMKAVAARLTQSIGDEALDQANLLPSRFALGPGFDAVPDTTEALKAKLDEVSKIVEGLLVLLRTGVPPILKLLREPAKQKAAEGLASELDEFATRVTGPQDARTKADEVRNRAIAAHGAEAAAIDGAGATRDVTVRDLDFEIKGLSLVAWSIWGLIALVLGTAWIFTDQDFGTTVDLVSSFAWGFGMTTFGAGIQNLTPSSVAAQMNVKVPK